MKEYVDKHRNMDEAEDELASGIGTRWIRLNLTYYHDPKVRRAGCAYLWPYLLVLMGEHRGYIPDDYLDPFLISQDLGVPEGDVERALEKAKSVGLLIRGSQQVNVGGRGGPNFRTLEGWTTKNWGSYQPDPRGPGRKRPREGKESTEPSHLHNNTSTKHNPPYSPPRGDGGGSVNEGEITISDLESLALECIPARRGRGRPISLDPQSIRSLVELSRKHTTQEIADELKECGGAERPIAMLKKRMASAPRKRANSPPSREEWKNS